MDIAAQTQAWSGQGLYHHRIKPAAVLDALRRFDGPVCFLDSDSIVKPGFHAEVSAKLAPQEIWSVTKTAVVMNHFELRNPVSAAHGLSHPAAASGRLSLRRGEQLDVQFRA